MQEREERITIKRLKNTKGIKQGDLYIPRYKEEKIYNLHKELVSIKVTCQVYVKGIDYNKETIERTIDIYNVKLVHELQSPIKNYDRKFIYSHNLMRFVNNQLTPGDLHIKILHQKGKKVGERNELIESLKVLYKTEKGTL